MLGGVTLDEEKFINSRKQFVPGIFSGKPLNLEESQKMQEIVGVDFYKDWQKYYNKNLRQMAIDSPQELDELIKYSNRYETTLPSQMKDVFGGNNPLYVSFMKDLSEGFQRDLSDGKKVSEAIQNIGNKLYEYYRNISRVKTFLNYKALNASVDWDEVAAPKLYKYDHNILKKDREGPMYKIGFGILDFNIWPADTPFSKVLYGEYFNELVQAVDRSKKFKNINLSYPVIVNKNASFIQHPLGKNKTDNNIENMFTFVQERVNKIKPIIIRTKNKGGTLTKEERQILDENIAEISYIFTNVKPFYRGSASANLAIVYALYEMAGIEAPQVKIGRALDLEAFATTPEEYRAKWLDLFSEKF